MTEHIESNNEESSWRNHVTKSNAIRAGFALLALILVIWIVHSWWTPSTQVVGITPQDQAALTAKIASVQVVAPTQQVVAVNSNNTGVQKVTVQHPFEEVPSMVQYRCRMENGAIVHLDNNDSSATGWCHD